MTRNVKSTLLMNTHTKGVFALEPPKFEWVRRHLCDNYAFRRRKGKGKKGLLKFIVFEERERGESNRLNSLLFTSI